MKTCVDLYPEEYYAFRSVRRRLAVWSVAFAAVVTVVSAASILMWQHVRRAEASLGILEAEVQGMELWGAQLTPLVGELEAARERQRVLAQLVNEPNWSALLDDLGEAAGDGVWLQTFSVNSEAQSKDNGTKAVRSVAIFGYAESADRFIHFMTTLTRSPYVTSVNQEYSRKSVEFDDDAILEFEVEAVLS